MKKKQKKKKKRSAESSTTGATAKRAKPAAAAAPVVKGGAVRTGGAPKGARKPPPQPRKQAGGGTVAGGERMPAVGVEVECYFPPSRGGAGWERGRVTQWANSASFMVEYPAEAEVEEADGNAGEWEEFSEPVLLGPGGHKWRLPVGPRRRPPVVVPSQRPGKARFKAAASARAGVAGVACGGTSAAAAVSGRDVEQHGGDSESGDCVDWAESATGSNGAQATAADAMSELVAAAAAAPPEAPLPGRSVQANELVISTGICL